MPDTTVDWIAMAADMAAVIEAVRLAIEDTACAPRPTEPPFAEFVQTYGPGLQGIHEHVGEGQFYIYARRYGTSIHETAIVVNVIPDNGGFSPRGRWDLDVSTQEILAAVETEFLMAGASLHHEGLGSEQTEAPWCWFMTWTWACRD